MTAPTASVRGSDWSSVLGGGDGSTVLGGVSYSIRRRFWSYRHRESTFCFLNFVRMSLSAAHHTWNDTLTFKRKGRSLCVWGLWSWDSQRYLVYERLFVVEWGEEDEEMRGDGDGWEEEGWDDLRCPFEISCLTVKLINQYSCWLTEALSNIDSKQRRSVSLSFIPLI